MGIRQLHPHLVNQIAAGEVIERPASVVKELAENALDAGATRIDVQVAAGGAESIRIADDGGGIALDELALAIAPHATSKIQNAEDLAAIHTLGFRGEALASIASVSRLLLTSRPANEATGGVIRAEGDRIDAPEPAGCAAGTVAEVRNLFFNTPARRKFMRTAATEIGHINETLTRLAMAHPSVGFKLTHNDRVTFDLPPDQSPSQRCIAQLGRGVAEAVLEFDANEHGIQLWGLAGQPAIARATAKQQYIYVNRRPVRDKRINHALREAYRGLMEHDKQPVIVLFVDLDAAEVDVNVHPAKAEVRFTDANRVHGIVLAAIRQRLLGADLTPTVKLPPNQLQLRPSESDAQSTFTMSPGDAPAPRASAPAAEPSGSAAEPHTDSDAVHAFVDYFRKMNPRQKGFIYQRVRQEMGEQTDAPGATDVDAPPLTESVRSTNQPILQVHDSYLVTQDEHGIVIVDQHALHERVMFQRLHDRITGQGKLESQRLLTPVTLEASSRRLDVLDQIGSLLAQLGIEAAPIGPMSIGIHAFPTLLFDRGVEPGAFLSDLLDRAEQQDFEPSAEAALHEVLDMMSCRAAVKAGDPLSDAELTELLRKRDDTERASSCPHGRPTTVRLSIRDLEKHFNRT
ncbi:MAG: DNA mismatch repair protein MutL [Planctomycetaceae bacterium]|nr:DNA mismatch repair protein MutL [Planctomycetaceae bacterium]